MRREFVQLPKYRSDLLDWLPPLTSAGATWHGWRRSTLRGYHFWSALRPYRWIESCDCFGIGLLEYAAKIYDNDDPTE